MPVSEQDRTNRRELATPRLRRASKAFSTLTLTFALGVVTGFAAVVANGAPRRARRPPQDGDPSPRWMSAHGWKAVLRRTWTAFNSDHIFVLAGGAAFFGLLAVFPALGVFVSLYGLFADVEQARLHLSELRGVLPEGAISVVGEQLTRLAAAPHASLGVTFLGSLFLSLLSSNAGMKTLITGLNVAYEEREKRGLLALNLCSLSFTVGAVALAIAAGSVLGLLARLGFNGSPLVAVLRWPVLLIGVVAVLSVLYRFAPSRPQARWRWITPGSAFAAFAWLAMSMLFSTYVANFGRYDKIYGSLGAVVGFMTWIWLSLTLLLLGAELNAVLEPQTASDISTGRSTPAGRREASLTGNSG